MSGTSTEKTVPYSTGESAITEPVRAEMLEICARYPQKRSALLPMLHLAQSVEGRVSAEAIEICAEMLDLTEAEVSAVATFYTMYKRNPVGKHHVGVCTNTLCAIMGGDAIYERVREHLGVGQDETTEDGLFTLEHVECNAGCDYAPVVMVNWEFFDNMTPESTLQLLADLADDKEVTSPRGGRITSWREAERVLAGFTDGQADAGPVGGEATLVGLKLARSNGWQAPGRPGDSDSGSTSGRQATEQAAPARAGTMPSDQPGAESDPTAARGHNRRRDDESGSGAPTAKEQ